jgi:hypothetical protein
VKKRRRGWEEKSSFTFILANKKEILEGKKIKTTIF